MPVTADTISSRALPTTLMTRPMKIQRWPFTESTITDHQTAAHYVPCTPALGIVEGFENFVDRMQGSLSCVDGFQLVESRPVAVFNMTDEAGGDAKVLCVPTDKRYDHIKSLADVPEQLKAEIQHFFERYKDLEPGKWVKGEGWEDLAAAEKMVQEAIDRFAAEGH